MLRISSVCRMRSSAHSWGARYGYEVVARSHYGKLEGFTPILRAENPRLLLSPALTAPSTWRNSNRSLQPVPYTVVYFFYVAFWLGRCPPRNLPSSTAACLRAFAEEVKARLLSRKRERSGNSCGNEPPENCSTHLKSIPTIETVGGSAGAYSFSVNDLNLYDGIAMLSRLPLAT
jgi:hypothetical protein